MNKAVKIIECPRDAMQGRERFIPTDVKIAYIRKLLEIGFDTIDFGSFVSAKAMPQMADTARVIDQLDSVSGKSKLLAIVANTRGAEEAAQYNGITYLGFPLSISETFQQRNTNKSVPEALNVLEEIKNICDKRNKQLVCYISMGFGNPYGDPYETSLVSQFVDILIALGADIISIADTVGLAESAEIESLMKSVSGQFPAQEIGVHLHSTPQTSLAKIRAAYRGGCRRFDGAIRGFGGCPMANDDLVGNIATETIISFLENENIPTGLNGQAFSEGLLMADQVFMAQE